VVTVEMVVTVETMVVEADPVETVVVVVDSVVVEADSVDLVEMVETVVVEADPVETVVVEAAVREFAPLHQNLPEVPSSDKVEQILQHHPPDK
jgi:hypothetical protein